MGVFKGRGGILPPEYLHFYSYQNWHLEKLGMMFIARNQSSLLAFLIPVLDLGFVLFP